MPQLLDCRALPECAPALKQAARALAEGALVAFPTETVYGLGARADDAAAVAAIFTAKGRPSDHPLIVPVADAQAALHWAADVPEVARRLMQAFWPGPLTLIVPRRPGVATEAAGGQDTVGLRCPSHPVALALLRAAAAEGVHGVAAPSANRFGHVSPTRAAHVMDEFPDRADLRVLDGGDCDVGIESAIVDCSRGQPVLLRPGGLSRSALAQAAGQPLAERDAQAPRASGTLEAHYAPRAPLRLMPRAQLEAGLPVLLSALGSLRPEHDRPALAIYHRGELPAALAAIQGQPRPRLLLRRLPDDAAQAAHELFAALRDFDAAGAPLIWVETPPDGDAWEGVRDRLQRAAAAAR